MSRRSAERSGLLAVALAAAIAMSLAPRLAWAQDQSLVPVQVQSQAPAATQSAAPQPNQDNATQADGSCPGHPGALGTSRVLALDPAQYPRVGLSLPKIRSVWIRSMSQNHRIIRADVCDPARAVDLHCRHFQVATQAGSREPMYAIYYNESRTHLSLHKDAPLHRVIQRSGTVVAVPVLGGLHHRYARI
jgi:hypothetical protein